MQTVQLDTDNGLENNLYGSDDDICDVNNMRKYYLT